MKNILVPTDFSDNCDKAAHLAVEMAALFQAEVHFLHLIKTPVNWVKLSKENEHRYPDTLKKIGAAKAKLKQLERMAEKRQLVNRAFLEYVSDHENIIKHSEHFDHDFIVTGSKGVQKGFFNQLLGSNAQRIIRNVHIPVLVVKEESIVFPFKNIVFVSDFKEDVTMAFKEVEKIALKCKAKIHFLNINTNSEFNSVQNGLQPIREFLNFFPKLENHAMHIYNEATVLDGIKKFKKANDVDLIAMYTHNRKGLSSIFSKSIAESVTNDSKKPVMTVHL